MLVIETHDDETRFRWGLVIDLIKALDLLPGEWVITESQDQITIEESY